MTIDWAGSPPFGRRKTLIATLDLLAKREGKCIVEVGTSEAYSPDGLGNALLAFAWYAQQAGGRVLAIDIREGAVQNSRKILAHYAPMCQGPVAFCRADAFEAAASMANCQSPLYMLQVDLVYYDAPSEPGSWYVELHRKWAHLFEPGALALFDDTDPVCDYAGKGMALIPELLRTGWRQLPVAGDPVFPMVLLEKMR